MVCSNTALPQLCVISFMCVQYKLFPCIHVNQSHQDIATITSTHAVTAWCVGLQISCTQCIRVRISYASLHHNYSSPLPVCHTCFQTILLDIETYLNCHRMHRCHAIHIYACSCMKLMMCAEVHPYIMGCGLHNQLNADFRSTLHAGSLHVPPFYKKVCKWLQFHIGIKE